MTLNESASQAEIVFVETSRLIDATNLPSGVSRAKRKYEKPVVRKVDVSKNELAEETPVRTGERKNS